MSKKQEAKSEEIKIPVLKQGVVKLRIIGTTPLYQNRIKEETEATLLLGGRRKTAVERLEIKHHPFEEYRAAMEQIDEGPTAIGIRAIAIKAAMCRAALETPGVTKSSAERLIYIPGEHFPLYGVPEIKIDQVRSADMNRTPDMRTRPFFPRWGAEVEIGYIMPQFSVSSIVALLCNAGFIMGVGDFRQEKGKGAYGLFRVLGSGDKDPEWNDLVKHHGRKQQEAAIASPMPADSRTERLLKAYQDELERRSQEQAEPKRSQGARRSKRSGANGHAEASA